MNLLLIFLDILLFSVSNFVVFIFLSPARVVQIRMACRVQIQIEDVAFAFGKAKIHLLFPNSYRLTAGLAEFSGFMLATNLGEGLLNLKSDDSGIRIKSDFFI